MRIATLSDLKDGQTIKFEFHREGLRIEGFVARFRGRVLAYENLCRHLPLSLDYADNRFFSSDGKNFVCQTHGALYEPITGLCIRGPCAGASLKPLEIELREDSVWLVTEEA